MSFHWNTRTVRALAWASLCWTAAAAQDVPPYFVKLIQQRTLFAKGEPAVLVMRLGNQTQGVLRARRFPDLLAGLTVARDGQPLEMSDRFSSKMFYKRAKSLDYGSHRDFRLTLNRYFPAMNEGGVFKVRYKDSNYQLDANNISIVNIEMPDLTAQYVLKTSMGDIAIELDVDQAPNHSRNFALLTAMSFFQDMVFHRVVKDYVIQTGDPLANGLGGSGYPMALEKSPFLKHRQFAVGMARGNDEDSASSQFYICLQRLKELDEGYSIFGKVVDGFETVEAIGRVPTSGPSGEPPNKPTADVKLFRVEIRPKNQN